MKNALRAYSTQTTKPPFLYIICILTLRAYSMPNNTLLSKRRPTLFKNWFLFKVRPNLAVFGLLFGADLTFRYHFCIFFILIKVNTIFKSRALFSWRSWSDSPKTSSRNESNWDSLKVMSESQWDGSTDLTFHKQQFPASKHLISGTYPSHSANFAFT